MSTECRVYEPEDYAILEAWWVAHGWSAVPENILPKLGLIISNEEKDICAGFLYMDNSVGVCWLEWVVTNPEATGFEAMKGIKALTKFMEKEADRMDYGVMMTTCRQASLTRLHEKNGFIKTDEGVTHLLRIVPREKK
jgi:hypothetical protein